jgi:hypothetical protein
MVYEPRCHAVTDSPALHLLVGVAASTRHVGEALPVLVPRSSPGAEVLTTEHP